MKTNLAIRINDIVATGQGDDRDTGRVVAVDGNKVTVAWDSHVKTTQRADGLSVVGHDDSFGDESGQH